MSTAKKKRSKPGAAPPVRGKGKTAGKSKERAQRERGAKREAAGADYETHAKLLSRWEQRLPMTDAERQTLEEIGAVRTDPGPEPAEVGEPLDDGWPAEADRTAPVIEPREMAELAGLLMSVATRLRTAAAPGAFGRKDFAASLDPVLADVATAVRLLVEFLNADCADNKLALASVERLRRGALSWPGIYYAHPAAQIREQKRKPKLGSKLPLKMNNAKGPSAEARAAVDVLLTVQEHIFWLLALQPQKDGRPAGADELEARRRSIDAAGKPQPGPTMAEAIADNEEHPLRLPLDKSGAVEKPATWGQWRRLFECVTKLRHGSEEQREEEIDKLGLDPDEMTDDEQGAQEARLPRWLRPVDIYANELAPKMERRTAARILGKIREHMRSYFDAATFDMERRPARAMRRKD